MGESPQPVDIEAEVKAALEREMRESEARLAAANAQSSAAANEEAAAQPASDLPASPASPAPAPVADPASAATAPAPTTTKPASLAVAVAEAFADLPLGAGDRVAELTTSPWQALRHLCLRPRRAGYAWIVCGVVDEAKQTAELRDFQHARVVHALRAGAELDLTPAEWEKLLQRAESVLAANDIAPTRTPPSAELLQRRRATRISRPALAAFLVVWGLAAIVVSRVLLVVGR